MKITILIAAVFLTTTIYGQGTTIDSTKKDYKNIIAIDATGFLKLFFNSSSTPFYPYSIYLLTYRRVIKDNAIKLAVGGNFNTANSIKNDSLKSTRSTNNFNFALGVEHYQYLNKRWAFYYGIDATTKYLISKNKSYRTSTEYYESKNETTSYGLSTALGILFHITKRINISTETSYNISYEESFSSSKEYSYSQYDRKSVDNGIHSTFFPPTSVYFRFKF